ncbi:MAG: hypothetical protein R2728_10790 [Chitinophagales bacterium]
MAIEKRIKAFVKLGEYISLFPEDLREAMTHAKARNQWFTIENIERSLTSIAKEFLAEDKLRAWLSSYNLKMTVKLLALSLQGIFLWLPFMIFYVF